MRFKDANGKIYYGEPSTDLASATVWEGADLWHLSRTEEIVKVAQVSRMTRPPQLLKSCPDPRSLRTGHYLMHRFKLYVACRRIRGRSKTRSCG